MKRIRLQEKDLNLVPLKITMRFNETELAIGTAFFYEHRGSSHLVTNWHNVTGRNPTTGAFLRQDGAVPNELLVSVAMNGGDEDAPVIRWVDKRLPLYRDEQMLEPLFHIHPVHKERVDLATYGLDGLNETAIVAANATKLELSQLRLRPGLDVFVLGYPRAMTAGARFPIWKRGSLASEPDIDIDGLPKLLIDTATREGMSGSPVFAQETGMWFEEDKTELQDAVLGVGRRFIGIYSGRVGDDTFQAQLGIVWKARAIEETIANALRTRE